VTTHSVQPRSRYNEKKENGDFTELSAISKSDDYTYYKVSYINAALYTATIIVAVWED